jgi:hypothetical protein
MPWRKGYKCCGVFIILENFAFGFYREGTELSYTCTTHFSNTGFEDKRVLDMYVLKVILLEREASVPLHIKMM